MTAVDALGEDDLSLVAGVITIVLVVVGGVLAIFITSVRGRIAVVVVVVSLAVVVWLQRLAVNDDFNSCDPDLHPTFFGVHVAEPDNYANYCGDSLKLQR